MIEVSSEIGATDGTGKKSDFSNGPSVQRIRTRSDWVNRIWNRSLSGIRAVSATGWKLTPRTTSMLSIAYFTVGQISFSLNPPTRVGTRTTEIGLSDLPAASSLAGVWVSRAAWIALCFVLSRG